MGRKEWFIWNGQNPRIKFSKLQLPKEKGGTSLPCLESYYAAPQLRYLVNWCNPHYDAKWKDLDQSQQDIALQSLIGDRSLYTIHSEKLNCWTKVPMNIWFKQCKKLKLEKYAQILRWVAHVSNFKPAQMDERYKHWTFKGITAYC